MTDRGIIFSGPMVCSIDQGDKTQTRRIPTRLLWCVRPNDRFYVREALRQCGETGALIYAADGRPVPAAQLPEGFEIRRPNIPGMLMPTWASRLTLIVKRCWAEELQAISEADARAEGVGEPYFGDGDPPFEEPGVMVSCRMQYRNLWNHLHRKPGQTWPDNPQIIALEFEVVRANIRTL